MAETEVDALELTLAAALNPNHPRHHAAELLCRMDRYYQTLPGMREFVRLLNRHDDGDVTALAKATDLAAAIVHGMGIIEEGVTRAGI